MKPRAKIDYALQNSLSNLTWKSKTYIPHNSCRAEVMECTIGH